MFILFFYTSNLQRDLIKKDYEKPLVKLQDVLDRGTSIYLPLDTSDTLE